MIRCAILYRLYNLKNVKNTHGGVLLLVQSCRLKQQSCRLQQHSSMGVFHVFKLYKWCKIAQCITSNTIKWFPKLHQETFFIPKILFYLKKLKFIHEQWEMKKYNHEASLLEQLLGTTFYRKSFRKQKTWCHPSILGEDLEILVSVVTGGADKNSN